MKTKSMMFEPSKKFSYTFIFSVEGAWTTWDNWGACSGTCNTNSRQRSMLYSGNLPCTGSSSETGPCDSEYFLILSKCFFGTCIIMNVNFQLRGHGQFGTTGVLAQAPVIQIQDNAQCCSVATPCAHPAQLTLDCALTVRICFTEVTFFLFSFLMVSLYHFQLKGHGQCGLIGVHALEPAIQTHGYA